MRTIAPNKYEEWLTTIANTRFLFNTIDELEEMLDAHSIHSNGIKRSFITPQRLRAAFRDLKVDTELKTNDDLQLDEVLCAYKTAWTFYRKNFYRRSNPEVLAMEMLNYCLTPCGKERIKANKATLYNEILLEDIDIPFLVLMLFKVIPGYDSKEGDVTNMPQHFENVMMFLEKFSSEGTMFQHIPAIDKAREETQKTRLMLYYHVTNILNVYHSYADENNLYDVANHLKELRIDLDLEGFWNESGGKLTTTTFWQIEPTIDEGTYFLTRWHKDAENRLTGLRYTLFLSAGADEHNIAYIIHPTAIKNKMRGIPYSDADHTWYILPATLDYAPEELPMQQFLNSPFWPKNIPLTRCTDEAVVTQYEKWLNHDCEIVKKCQHLEYYFLPNIYAITQTHIYIPSENEGEYYKVPKSAHKGLENIHLTDNVGLLTMDEKTYIAFDELLLFIPTTLKHLKKYNIERVTEIS